MSFYRLTELHCCLGNRGKGQCSSKVSFASSFCSSMLEITKETNSKLCKIGFCPELNKIFIWLVNLKYFSFHCHTLISSHFEQFYLFIKFNLTKCVVLSSTVIRVYLWWFFMWVLVRVCGWCIAPSFIILISPLLWNFHCSFVCSYNLQLQSWEIDDGPPCKSSAWNCSLQQIIFQWLSQVV